MYIVRNEKDMAGLVQQAIGSLREIGGEMLVLPMLVARTLDDSLRILWSSSDFNPRRASDDLPADAIGIVRLSAERTVHDALDDQNLSLKDAAEMLLVAECGVAQHVPGRTRRVNTMFGVYNVDLQEFALRSGLPLRSRESTEYATFLLEAPRKRFGDTQLVVVCVKGTRDTTAGGGAPDERALVSLLSRMEADVRCTDDAASVYVRDLQDGWQLLRHPLFTEACGWFSGGYYHVVQVDGDRGGLNIPY